MRTISVAPLLLCCVVVCLLCGGRNVPSPWTCHSRWTRAVAGRALCSYSALHVHEHYTVPHARSYAVLVGLSSPFIPKAAVGDAALFFRFAVTWAVTVTRFTFVQFGCPTTCLLACSLAGWLDGLLACLSWHGLQSPVTCTRSFCLFDLFCFQLRACLALEPRSASPRFPAEQTVQLQSHGR